MLSLSIPEETKQSINQFKSLDLSYLMPSKQAIECNTAIRKAVESQVFRMPNFMKEPAFQEAIRITKNLQAIALPSLPATDFTRKLNETLSKSVMSVRAMNDSLLEAARSQPRFSFDVIFPETVTTTTSTSTTTTTTTNQEEYIPFTLKDYYIPAKDWVQRNRSSITLLAEAITIFYAFKAFLLWHPIMVIWKWISLQLTGHF